MAANVPPPSWAICAASSSVAGPRMNFGWDSGLVCRDDGGFEDSHCVLVSSRGDGEGADVVPFAVVVAVAAVGIIFRLAVVVGFDTGGGIGDCDLGGSGG